MNTLTKDELRVRVAESLGYHFFGSKRHRWNFGLWDEVDAKRYATGPYGEQVPLEALPDYPADLNAMSDAEKTLTEPELGVYIVTLYRETYGGNLEDFCGTWGEMQCVAHATAEQRARAFVAVKEGK